MKELISKPDTLWVRVLMHKYNFNRVSCSYHIMKSGYSNLWRSRSKLWCKFIKNVRWSINDGASISFWSDIWLGDLPLLNNATDKVFLVDMRDRVRDYMMSNGEWDKYRLTFMLPVEMVKKILYLIHPSLSASLDMPYWALTSFGDLTISSTYDQLKTLFDSDKRVRHRLLFDASCSQCCVVETEFSIFDVPWSIIFVITYWYIWKCRNLLIFEGCEISLEKQLSIIKNFTEVASKGRCCKNHLALGRCLPSHDEDPNTSGKCWSYCSLECRGGVCKRMSSARRHQCHCYC
ncbi:Uncharacterized protein TCM_025332 [Theobroma cacao]|uniref:Uncharacterized protein n=1 Tax=Theobroma cacao TaxID=3641 RepID=A0A061EZ61_THECC|nr:Uncharacterized protein TCM_025332 [Theobroma cacao]